MKLLIADDDLTTRTMLAAATQKWGFKPILAENGETAWQILQRKDPPQLLLLDWMMPQPDGLNLCRKIQQLKSSNPPFIILLTARNKTNDIVTGLESGANDYIVKPFENAELQARLQVGRRMIKLQTQLNAAAEALVYQASHDELTGLINRRTMMNALEKEIARAQRESQSLCIGLCDIDHFKQVNDTYGHLAGDAVLQEISKRLASSLRPYDHVGRYGGEEFLIILNATAEKAFDICGRIGQAIADTPIIVDGTALHITISYGITLFTPPDDHRDRTALLAAADSALYEAKENGRNQMVFHNPKPVT